jgi:ATP-dependent Clp protease protease subunit
MDMTELHTPFGTGDLHSAASRLAESRYVLPSFVERTNYGIKESNPYNKLSWLTTSWRS